MGRLLEAMRRGWRVRNSRSWTTKPPGRRPERRSGAGSREPAPPLNRAPAGALLDNEKVVHRAAEGKRYVGRQPGTWIVAWQPASRPRSPADAWWVEDFAEALDLAATLRRLQVDGQPVTLGVVVLSAHDAHRAPVLLDDAAELQERGWA